MSSSFFRGGLEDDAGTRDSPRPPVGDASVSRVPGNVPRRLLERAKPAESAGLVSAAVGAAVYAAFRASLRAASAALYSS